MFFIFIHRIPSADQTTSSRRRRWRIMSAATIRSCTRCSKPSFGLVSRVRDATDSQTRSILSYACRYQFLRITGKWTFSWTCCTRRNSRGKWRSGWAWTNRRTWGSSERFWPATRESRRITCYSLKFTTKDFTGNSPLLLFHWLWQKYIHIQTSLTHCGRAFCAEFYWYKKITINLKRLWIFY